MQHLPEYVSQNQFFQMHGENYVLWSQQFGECYILEDSQKVLADYYSIVLSRDLVINLFTFDSLN